MCIGGILVSRSGIKRRHSCESRNLIFAPDNYFKDSCFRRNDRV